MQQDKQYANWDVSLTNSFIVLNITKMIYKTKLTFAIRKLKKESKNSNLKEMIWYEDQVNVFLLSSVIKIPVLSKTDRIRD